MPKASFKNGCLVIKGNDRFIKFMVCPKIGAIDKWIEDGEFMVKRLKKAGIKFCKNLIKNSGEIINVLHNMFTNVLKLTYENELKIELSKHWAKVFIFGVELKFGTNDVEVKYNQKVFMAKSAKNAYKAFMNKIYGEKIDFRGRIDFKVKKNRLNVYVNGKKFADLGLHDYKVNSGKFLYVRAVKIDTREFEKWVVRMYKTNFDEAEFKIENNIYSIKIGYLYFIFAERRKGSGYELRVIGYEDDNRFKLRSDVMSFFIKYVGYGERLYGEVSEISRYEAIEKDEQKDKIFRYLTF